MSLLQAFSPPQPLPVRIPASIAPLPSISPLSAPLMVTLPGTSSSPVNTDFQFSKQRIGSSDLVLTEVCLGTMTFGVQNTEEEAHAQLDMAHERGVIGIDTAELYPVPPSEETCGATERFVGSWIKARGGDAFRQQLVLCSKVAGGSGSRSSIPWIRGSDRKVDQKGIFAAVDGVLQRLGTDYIDLFQIHWPDRYVPLFGLGAYEVSKEVDSVSIEEQVAAMDKLIRDGKVLHYGLSNETAWGVSQFHAVAKNGGYARPVSIQNSYSLIYRDFEGHLAEACAPRNADMGLLAYSPLAGGALTGKYLSPNVPKTARYATFPGYMERFQSSLAMEAIAEYNKIAKDAGLTLTQLALAWCNSRWFMGSTIIGATSVEQLEENLNAFAVKLDDATIDAVNAVYTRYRDPSKTS